jgi:hypothetical protein
MYRCEIHGQRGVQQGQRAGIERSGHAGTIVAKHAHPHLNEHPRECLEAHSALQHSFY